MTSHIEVKGNYDSNSATRYFSSRTQPWMWEKFQIYVQLCKVPRLFQDTFIPKRILHNFFHKKDVYTGKGYKRKLKANKGDKKLRWPYRNLKQYIDGE